MVAMPYGVSAESPQGTSAAEQAPAFHSQQLDLPSYRDPQSPLPGIGMTSQVFTSLGAVLGLMALAFYLYKRIALRGSRDVFRDGSVRILSRTYLGPKESLCLVQVGSDVLLLGQTSTGITLLHTLPPNASTAAVSGGRDGEAPIRSLQQTERREPSEFARERSAALAGLEGRLRRLNELWRAPVPGPDRGEVSG